MPLAMHSNWDMVKLAVGKDDMFNEQNLGLLGYIGDEILPSYIGII